MPYPDVLGYFAPPGTATSIGVRFVKTERLPNPYGTCTTQTMLEEKHYKGPYEVESCFRNCLQEKIIKNCGCYDPEYPHANDSTILSCDTVNDTLSRLDCIERISNADSSVFDIIKECNCPQPCK
ncbi:unnamed protein product [Cylicostephanus goldi]|uniref:Uncharacterized protein n=1 Tax=Cylicostephanus goldi TaxID=71465 RepID=A0A3P7N650_CYLGO|nr:unnamed protein product [Cylicostephanus goldi]